MSSRSGSAQIDITEVILSVIDSSPVVLQGVLPIAHPVCPVAPHAVAADGAVRPGVVTEAALLVLEAAVACPAHNLSAVTSTRVQAVSTVHCEKG